MGKGLALKLSAKPVRIFILAGLVSCTLIQGQIFPLKTGSNHRYLETARGLPFFLNASTWQVDSIHPRRISRQIKNLNIQGFNAIAMNLKGSPFPYSGLLHTVKRTLRIARRNKMAVLIYPLLPPKSTPDKFYAATLNKYRNLIWIYPDSCQAEALSPDPDILTGHWVETPAGKMRNSICLLRAPEQYDPRLAQPQVLVIETSGKSTPELHKTIRQKIYQGIILGMAGFVCRQPAYLHNDSDTLAAQIHLAKQFFELFPWQQFRRDSVVVKGENTNRTVQCISAQDNTFLKIVYFSRPATISLPLTGKHPQYKTEWISPINGKSQEATILPSPVIQMFFPPLTPPESDWILVIAGTEN